VTGVFATALRVVVGGLFVGHGTQKLFGWFGGGGPAGTGQLFEKLGLRPGRRNAIAAGSAEAGGGLLLASGVATPLAAAGLTGTMVSAIRHVHFANGLWSTDGGYEYNLVLLAAAAAVTEREAGAGWALAQLVAGAAGSVAMTELAKRHAEPEPARAEPPARDEPAWSPADFDRERAALAG
jgi:putative oxidoreductase